MKKCSICGKLISDSSEDLCEDCKKMKEFTWEETFLNSLASVIIILGTLPSFVMFFIELDTIELSTVFEGNPDYSNLLIPVITFISSLIIPTIIRLFVRISRNIRLMSIKNNNSNE